MPISSIIGGSEKTDAAELNPPNIAVIASKHTFRHIRNLRLTAQSANHRSNIGLSKRLHRRIEPIVRTAK